MSPALPGCPFCLIAAGGTDALVIAADDDAVAFLDTHPAAPGHTLVIPRLHHEDIWALDDRTAMAVMRMARRTAHLLRERLGMDGLTMRQNNGAASGQKVPHLHLHLVPRWTGDGTVGWPWPPKEHDPAEVHGRLTS